MTAPTERRSCPPTPPPPVTFVRGEGSRALGRRRASEYLDFLVRPGRHLARPRPPRGRRRRLPTQARTLLHVSNLFGTEPGREVAATLDRLLGGGGPGLLLQLRRRGQRVRHQAGPQVGRPRPPRRRQRLRLVPRPHPRHPARHRPAGRSTRPFQPLPEGFRHVAWDDLDALEAALDPSVAAVLLEPVQGEGGVQPGRPPSTSRASAGCATSAASCSWSTRCRPASAAPGGGSASSTSACEPDVVTMAKALGNGMPIGACWARAEVAAAFEPGDHATTFGGQPLAAAAARAVLAVMEAEDVPGPGRARRAPACADGARGAPRRRRGARRSACSWPPSCERPRRQARSPPAPSTPASSSTPVTADRPAARPAAARHRRRDRRGASPSSPRSSPRAAGDGGRRDPRTSSRSTTSPPPSWPTVLDLAQPTRRRRRCSPARAWPCSSRSRRPAPATPPRWRSCSSAATPSPSGADEVGLDARETAEDVARTLACYHAAIGARVFDHAHARAHGRGRRRCPVVNLLSDDGHPLPGPRRPAHPAPASSGDLAGPHRRLRRRRQQRGPLAWRWPPRMVGHATSRIASPAGLRARPPSDLDRVRAGAGADVVVTDRPGRGGRRAPTPSTPTSGPRWARRPRPRRGARPSPASPVDDALHGAGPRRTPSSCTACPPTAARRSPPRCSTGPQSRVWPQAANRMHAARGAAGVAASSAETGR